LNGGKDVLSIDSLSFFVLAFLAGLTGNKGNKFRDALLNSFLSILGDFGIVRQGFLHDSSDVGDGQKARIVGGISKLLEIYLSPCLSPSI
jgi:hypothetical protein